MSVSESEQVEGVEGGEVSKQNDNGVVFLKKQLLRAKARVSILEQELAALDMEIPDDDAPALEATNLKGALPPPSSADAAVPDEVEKTGNRASRYCVRYWAKWKGEKLRGSPSLAPPWFIVFAFLGSFLAIAAVGLLDQYLLHPFGYVGMIGSFGATAVLLFGTESPLAQPRPLLLGHVLSAFVGVTVYTAFGGSINFVWLMSALAVSISIALMHLTKSVHPPAGATALIAVTGSAELRAQGFLYIALPVLVGALLLMLVALLTMNLKYRYPRYWI